ncbi:MAG: TPM domain-containing protein [Candidatus Omnitrophica bacterium]|nr:TPM domain-containing protein [Candidatus Omnitrophota bacterium]
MLGQNAKREIVKAITEAERFTSGEIRVHVKRWCRGGAPAEAWKVFRRLKMDRTKERNGVLLFVALRSRRFAIVGDRGIHEKAGEAFWNRTCGLMGSYFSQGKVPEGIVAGVRSAGEELGRYFPRKAEDVNELPDGVTSE